MKAINKMDLADFKGIKTKVRPSKTQSVCGVVEKFRPLGRSSHQEAECSRAPCDSLDRYGQQKSLYTRYRPDGVTQQSVDYREYVPPSPQLGSQAAHRVRGGNRLQYPVPPSLSKNNSLYHRFRLPPAPAPKLENRKPTKRKMPQEDKPAFAKRSRPSLINTPAQGQSLHLNTSELGESSQPKQLGAPILGGRFQSGLLNTPAFAESNQSSLLNSLALGMQGQSRVNAAVLKESPQPGLLNTPTLGESAQSKLLNTLIKGMRAQSSQSSAPARDQSQRAGLLRSPSPRKSAESGLLNDPLLRRSAEFGLLDAPAPRESAESGLLNTPSLRKNAKSGLLNAPTLREIVRSGLSNAPALGESAESGLRHVSSVSAPAHPKANLKKHLLSLAPRHFAPPK
ncbi:uncharacterized protein LOC122543839 [Chiloscyllium plagiosum]|uniref:uncharacterized protein LOC122543839 n=1 Tax=Chiloscyllium plagiosum TaxID=36176 RepID=UPI001CB87414|nr:uncharacterized protein LOC122543839 [Chiloscyllium plagiosum]XP_043538588.1 uncharacterized protein LOC122543839 [Chiloscyllium plagiosum]